MAANYRIIPWYEEQRLRPRAKITLPVRVRQIGPPRDSIEITSTLDVSRNGIRIRTRQRYTLHGTVWVTMPFNSEAMLYDPEFPASVVRIEKSSRGDAQVAVRFRDNRSDPWEPTRS